MSGWIGVDLDGTLALDNQPKGFYDPTHIGEPVPAMLSRVREWLALNYEVRVFTARAENPEYVPAIKAWLLKHLGTELAVTNVKDRHCWMIWDDRAIHVEKNTGSWYGTHALFARRPGDAVGWTPATEHLAPKATQHDPRLYICWDMVSERMTFGNHEPISEEEHADLLKALTDAAVAKGFTFGGGSRRATEAEIDEPT